MTTMTNRQLPLGNDSAMLAVNVLKGFIDSLPLKSVDKKDLWGFVGDWFGAEDDEERDYIEKAIREVLQGPQGKVLPLDLEAKEGAPDGYRKWVNWVSEQIKKQRTTAGLTQLQLAEKSGLPQSHISRIENAVHSPSQATLGKIAAALGLSLSDFDPSASDDLIGED